MTKVSVDGHDEVKAGQILGEIDFVPLTRSVEEATAKRKVAEAILRFEEATLDRLEKEHPRRVAVAEKELASADAACGEARAMLRMTALDVDKAVNEAKAEAERQRARGEFGVSATSIPEAMIGELGAAPVVFPEGEKAFVPASGGSRP